MANEQFAFVDSIVDSPTILLNLHDFSPFHVKSWSAPPPPLSRSTSRSNARDGDNVSQSSYADREILVELAVNSSTPDEAAEAIQALARLLNSDGQWLRINLNTIEPVWFLTKRAEIEQIDDFNGVPVDGFRVATIRIPAEPFAYGLEVTGTATISNDPSATGGLTYSFPDIQGDVKTPLSLKLDPFAPVLYPGIVAMCSASDAPLAPVHGWSVTSAPPVTGWTNATVSEADAIGGSATEYARSTGSLSRGIELAMPDSPPGDYRLLARFKSSGTMRARLWRKGTPAPLSSTLLSSSGGTYYRWIDFGVISTNDDRDSVPPGLEPPNSIATQLLLTLDSATTADSARVDEVLMIPAGIGGSTDSLMTFRASDSIYPVTLTRIESGASKVWMEGASSGSRFAASGGGLPYLSPGSRNVLTLLNPTGLASTAVPYMYRPRYLYIRPATS